MKIIAMGVMCLFAVNAISSAKSIDYMHSYANVNLAVSAKYNDILSQDSRVRDIVHDGMQMALWTFYERDQKVFESLDNIKRVATDIGDFYFNFSGLKFACQIFARRISSLAPNCYVLKCRFVEGDTGRIFPDDYYGVVTINPEGENKADKIRINVYSQNEYKGLSNDAATIDISKLIANYKDLSDKKRSAVRHKFSRLLVDNYEESFLECAYIFDELFNCREKKLHPRVVAVVLREIMIQPMASSWWIIRNLEDKYGIQITVSELIKYYEVIQGNKFIQDLIRFNSTATKVVAVARGIFGRKAESPYVMDVHVSDVCVKKCRKCWNCRINVKGGLSLLKRKRNKAAKTPNYEDFKSILEQGIDMHVKIFAFLGGGEPLECEYLSDLIEDARNYAKERKQNVRFYVSTGGLGCVFQDKNALRKLIRNLDIMRVSVDSFDEEFICYQHGISKGQYDDLMKNIEEISRLRKILNPNMELELLVLLYGGNHRELGEIIRKAGALGFTRVSINSIVGREEDIDGEMDDSEMAKTIKKIAEKNSRGEFTPLKVDITPELLENCNLEQKIPLHGNEPCIGKVKYCLKTLFGFDPVVTADGVVHTCFLCSQPNIANKTDRFKIGNIMESSLKVLSQKMRDKGMGEIKHEEDCISNCREITFWNAILRKVIEDQLMGISLDKQPFFDKTSIENTHHHALHNEVYREKEVSEHRKEVETITDSIQQDKIRDFEDVIKDIINGIIIIDYDEHEDGEVIGVFSRYQTNNLFDVYAIKWGEEEYVFSYDLGRFCCLMSGEKVLYSFEDNRNYPNPNMRKFIRLLNQNKKDGKIFLIKNKDIAIEDEISMIKKEAKFASFEIPTNVHKRYRLIVPFEFFGNDKKAFDRHKGLYGDSFDIALARGKDKKYIESLLEEAKGFDNRAIALVPDNVSAEGLERLNHAGVRFIKINFDDLLFARDFRQNTYAIMLLTRRIDEINPDSSIYKTLSFFIKTLFKLKGVEVADYIKAIVDGKISVLVNGILTFKPAGEYDMPKYYEIAPIITSP